jgi:deoxyribodipyrimidine photo-lyase
MFNPTLQQRKLDPDGAYVKRYVPELGTGRYPQPIVDHAEVARRRRAGRLDR